ncbi:high mobility group box domain-containing protein, partial [Lenzites betulinus]
HIKRPENAFMLFRKSRVHLYNAGAPRKQTQSRISKLVSSDWHSLTPEEKQPWFDLAQKVAAEHRQRHPNYKYRPRRRK